MGTSTTGKTQNAFLKPIGAFFRRFHMIIFFVAIVACVAAAILIINNSFTAAPTDDGTATGGAQSADQATINRIQSLHSSSAPAPAPTLPTGRTNPFAE